MVYDLEYDNEGNIIDAIIMQSTHGGIYDEYKNGGAYVKTKIKYKADGTPDNHYLFHNFRTNNSIKEGSINLAGSIKNLSAWRFFYNSTTYSEEIKDKYAILRFVKKDANGNIVLNYAGAEYNDRDHNNESIVLSEDRLNYSKLYIEKTVDKFDGSIVEPGDTLTYSIYIKNNSAENYDNDLIVEENVSELVTYKGSTRTETTKNKNASNKITGVTWNVGKLSSGQEITIEYTVQVNENTEGNEIKSEGKVGQIKNSIVKNKINNNLTDEQCGQIKNKTNTKINSAQVTGKELINEIYNETLGIDLKFDDFEMLCSYIGKLDENGNRSDGNKRVVENGVVIDDEYILVKDKYVFKNDGAIASVGTTVLSLNNRNKFSKMVFNNYWNSLANSSGEYNLKKWESYDSENRRADTINCENFKTGDILIYQNSNDATTNENGEYAYIYIEGQGFVGLNYGNDGAGQTADDRNEFNAEYYSNDPANYDYHNLYSYNRDSYDNKSLEYKKALFDKDFMNYQTLFGKDNYLILRPSSTIENINYNLGVYNGTNNNPTQYVVGDDLELVGLTKTGYTFGGWYTDAGFTNKVENISELDGDVTLYAKWEINTYTVTWKDENGTVLETDNNVPHGTTPIYNGATPTKARTAQYTYTFSGWTPSVVPATGNVTYTATYTSTVNTYTVTWKDENGTVLETDNNVPYGTMPTYDGGTPTKVGNAQYSYNFTGWTPNVVSVVGNTTYTATYEQIINTYTVTWKNHDGTVIETDESVEYGTMPTYDGETPKRRGGLYYSYSFSGWTPDIETVTGDVEYTATYAATLKKSTITWKNDDGSIIDTTSVPYGERPTHADPTKEGNAQYSYTFTGWTPTIWAVWDDTTYTATYEATVNKYTVTWKDENGTVLETDENVEYGTMPTYDGETPIKAEDAENTYGFAGWNAEITQVTGDVTYTATYTSTIRKYTVVWKNEDGTVIETDENVEYGTMPTYDGETPIKAEDAENTYAFAGWTPNVAEVTGDVEYTAIYTPTIRKYTVVWKNENGTVIETDESVEYGTMPTYDGETPSKAEDAGNTYAFAGWDAEVTQVTGDVTYTATYTPTKRKYTVIWKNEDGTVLETDENVEYGTIPTYDGETPTKEGNDDYINVFAGWNTEVIPVTGDTTYTATFETAKRSYTARFIIGLGEEDIVISKEWGEKITSPEVPSKEGYTFKEWNKEIPTTMPKENTEYIAIWEGEEERIDSNITAEELITSKEEEGHSVRIVERDGETEVEEGRKIATGMKIIIDETYIEPIVVLGDINGDGEIGISDLTEINNYRKDQKELEGEYYKAADLNNDGEVNIVDSYLMICYRMNKIRDFKEASIRKALR